MKNLVLTYSPELDKRLTNLAAVRRGTGCTVLECVVAHDDHTLIAKQWRRRKPRKFDAVVIFPKTETRREELLRTHGMELDPDSEDTTPDW